MYHSIREGNEGRKPYFETNTSVQVFDQHMRFLHENGYRTLSLGKAVEMLAGNGTCEQSVAITFDDGYADFYTHAYPLLREHGFTATVFVLTGLLKAQRMQINGKDCLTLAEVRELHSQGVNIGSHTISHPELKLLPQDEVENELSTSKRTLEDALGAPVKSFAYPFAFPETDQRFVSSLCNLLEECGYENGVTTILGTAQPRHNPKLLPRLPINSWDDPRFFQAKLEGGYDWLHGPQYLAKAVSRFLS
jgi:peptidoglycan/xylan/chitin deacetylase (PgdA/CDA1 family)